MTGNGFFGLRRSTLLEEKYGDKKFAESTSIKYESILQFMTKTHTKLVLFFIDCTICIRAISVIAIALFVISNYQFSIKST